MDAKPCSDGARDEDSSPAATLSLPVQSPKFATASLQFVLGQHIAGPVFCVITGWLRAIPRTCVSPCIVLEPLLSQRTPPRMPERPHPGHTSPWSTGLPYSCSAPSPPSLPSRSGLVVVSTVGSTPIPITCCNRAWWSSPTESWMGSVALPVPVRHSSGSFASIPSEGL